MEKKKTIVDGPMQTPYPDIPKNSKPTMTKNSLPVGAGKKMTMRKRGMGSKRK